MAEILVRWTDNTHADPAKDAWCYKRGDVVVVMPDGHEWGRKEGPPHFRVVKLVGVAVDEVRETLLEPVRDLFMMDGDEMRAIGRRATRIDPARLRTAEATALDRDGSVTVSRARAEDLIRSKDSDAQPLREARLRAGA